MLTLETAMGPVDISADRLEERKRLVQKILSSDSEDMVLHHVKGQLELQMEALAYCIQARGYPAPERIRMLNAHGGVRDGKYAYGEMTDGRWYFHHVDDWIDLHERENNALFIHTCNDDENAVSIYPRENCFVAYARHYIYEGDIIMLALELLDKIEVVPPRHCSAPLGTAQPREFRSIEVLGHLRDGILRLYNKLEQCD